MLRERTPPLLRMPRWSSPAMVALVLSILACTAVAAGAFFYRLGLAQQRLGARDHDVALWAVAQLDREVRRLDDALRVWRNGEAPFSTVSLRLDVVASRIETFAQGDFGQPLAFRRRELEILDAITPMAHGLDRIVPLLPQQQDRVAAVSDARQLTRGIEARMGELMNLVVQAGSEDEAATRAQSYALYRALGLSAGALVVLVGMALTAVLAQNRALYRARRRAEQIGSELQRTAAAAQAAARAKATFLATMSHEIRTPMNGVLGAASLLGASELTREQRRRVEMIAAGGQALLALIDDILDFSKLEAGRTEFELDRFSPRELVEAVADICGPISREKGLDFVLAVDADVPEALRSDCRRLRQVLVNLVSNAMKFTEAGGVAVRASMEAGEGGRCLLRCEVADTGIGIGPDTMAGLFREFEQGDTEIGRRYGGTGLGLAICKRIVENLGGQIGVESAPGEGSRFWVRIPVAVEAPAPTVPRRGQAAVVAPDGPVRQGVEALLDAAGFAVVDAPHGTGLVLVHDRMPDPATGAGARVLRFGPGGTLPPPLTAGSLHDALDEAEGGAVTEPPKPLATRPLRLLVAEDNAMNREVMEQVLVTMGHEVTLAENGAEAVAVMRTGQAFDAVLLDLQMPVMDGLTAAREIRALGGRAGRTRLLAVTANALQTDRDACRQAGMDGFLAKPVTIARLTEALGGMSGAPAVGPERTIDDAHRHALSAALPDGALRRLLETFWEEAGPLLADLHDTAAREDTLHRLAGAAATVGYAAAAAAARALRGSTAPPDALLDELRCALEADRDLLPADLSRMAGAALG